MITLRGIKAVSLFHSQSDIPGQSNTGIIKRTSIYYTRSKTQPVAEASLSVSSIAPSTRIAVSPLKPCNVDTTKPQATSSVRKQVAWADQGKDWLASVVHALVCGHKSILCDSFLTIPMLLLIISQVIPLHCSWNGLRLIHFSINHTNPPPPLSPDISQNREKRQKTRKGTKIFSRAGPSLTSRSGSTTALPCCQLLHKKRNKS